MYTTVHSNICVSWSNFRTLKDKKNKKVTCKYSRNGGIIYVFVSQRSIYVGSRSGVVQVPMAACQRYTSCYDCVFARDPFCGWDGKVCVEISSRAQRWGNTHLHAKLPEWLTVFSVWQNTQQILAETDRFALLHGRSRVSPPPLCLFCFVCLFLFLLKLLEILYLLLLFAFGLQPQEWSKLAYSHLDAALSVKREKICVTSSTRLMKQSKYPASCSLISTVCPSSREQS